MSDTHFMQAALRLAEKGLGWTSPNPAVGAVVVKNGEVIGQGWHQGPGQPHAEVNAILDAGDTAAGSTLYVTLEPCNHTGRTPPCTHKILETGITKVIMAMADPNPEVKGGGMDFLRSKGIAVEQGLCEAEARKQNEVFVKHTITSRPFTVAKCASTLDGRIATTTGDSKWITGPESRNYGHQLRHQLDGILVGIGTINQDDPSLTARLPERPSKDPQRIVLDSNLSISPDAKILHQDSEAGNWIFTGPEISETKRQKVESSQTKIIKTPLQNGRIDLDYLVTYLGTNGITGLLIEGGSQVLGAALMAGIIDKICFFYAPKIIGGNGIPITSGMGVNQMADCLNVTDIQIHQFENDLLVEGYVENNKNFLLSNAVS
jgi:diaminohydroxyphosphoribosylaminopyrimidine deaminase / 5-amino-6-(5-phosphoribosylamino)uracil reductase